MLQPRHTDPASALGTLPEPGQVPNFWAQSIAQHSGLLPEQIQAACDHAGVSLELLQQPNATIAHESEVNLIEALARISDNAFLGAQIGLAHNPRHGSILTYLLFSSATLGDALETLCHFVPLTRPNAKLALIKDSDRVVFKIGSTNTKLQLAVQYAEFVVAATLKTWRIATGVKFLPCEVTFASPRRNGADHLARLLRCPVRLGGEDTEIALPISMLELPMLSADHGLLVHLTSYGELLLRQARQRPVSLVDRVRHELLKQLSRGGPSLSQTADSLGMSQRTLTRRLAENGATFRGVSDDARRMLAEAYLADPALAIAEIAFLLGYLDQSSFGTAFRRWTDETPRRFRERVLANPDTP